MFDLVVFCVGISQLADEVGFVTALAPSL